jgi:hypothetical protein
LHHDLAVAQQVAQAKAARFHFAKFQDAGALLKRARRAGLLFGIANGTISIALGKLEKYSLLRH